MKTRYTVQYWYIDKHDTMSCDFDTLEQARKFATNLDKSKYKDIDIYARHWQYINEPFESIITAGLSLDDWKWVLVDDDYIQYYTASSKAE